MFGFGLGEQKKAIPVVIDSVMPLFFESIRTIYTEAGVHHSKCNWIECAIFGFWSIRLGFSAADGTMADKYAADEVLASCIRRWINLLAKQSGQRPTSGGASAFYKTVRERYGEYLRTVETTAFRRSPSGNLDMPITEQTIHHFMRRTSLDSETLNALAPRIPQFNVALREAQWAFAGIMKPVIQGD